jgi:hypothetical protein
MPSLLSLIAPTSCGELITIPPGVEAAPPFTFRAYQWAFLLIE